MATTTESTNAAVEDWQIQRDANKSLGDAAFRSKNYAEAISHYTQALSLDPTHFVLLSNRSAAHLSNGEKSKALHDAQACIQSSPKFAKGHSRLAAALQSLGRWGPAKEAYEKVLMLDNDNAAAKKGYEDCRLKEEEEQDTQESEETNKKEEKKEEADEEEDLLADFFNEVATVQKPKNQVEEISNNVISSHKMDLGSPESQIERLLAPNYKWRNLNPFHVLDISHTASEDDISRRYKALSLLLHPDKNPSAKEAYDEVQRAKSQLDNEDKSRHIRQLIEEGLKKGAAECRKGENLKEAHSKAVQRIFAELEYKRREIEKRQRQQEQREREQEQEEAHKEKKSREFDKNWRDDTRVEKRIGSWRGFQKKKKPKL
jgi:tetratricopeptide (TPR) repeat protein